MFRYFHSFLHILTPHCSVLLRSYAYSLSKCTENKNILKSQRCKAPTHCSSAEMLRTTSIQDWITIATNKRLAFNIQLNWYGWCWQVLFIHTLFDSVTVRWCMRTLQFYLVLHNFFTTTKQIRVRQWSKDKISWHRLDYCWMIEWKGVEQQARRRNGWCKCDVAND